MKSCLDGGPSFTRTLDTAKREQWPPLAADMAMAFTPVGDPIAIEGWLTRDGSAGTFEAVVAFRAEASGKRIEGCTTAYSGSNAEAFEKALATDVKAQALGEEQGQDTVYKRYSAVVGGRDVAITLALPRYPKGDDQVLASAVAEELVEN
jgi:hypothetical protein